LLVGGEAVGDRGSRGLFRVLAHGRVDDDPNEEPHDLLALFVGQPGVQTGAYLQEEITDLLRHNLGHRGLCGGEAGF
jgi:hypothetical protein